MWKHNIGLWGRASSVQKTHWRSTGVNPYARHMHSREKTTFCCFSLASLRKRPSVSAQIHMDINLQIQLLSFTHSHFERSGSRGRQALETSREKSFSLTLVFRVYFISFVICILLPWVVKPYLSRVLSRISILFVRLILIKSFIQLFYVFCLIFNFIMQKS